VHAQDRYKTILVIVTGLLSLSLIIDQPILTKIAAIIGLLAVFFAAAARAIEYIWLKVAAGLGWINSRILLSIVFYLFLLPMAWFSRWFTRDSLNLKRNNAISIFHTRNHKYRKKDLEDIW
jgi:hypothetical protein